MDDTIGLLEKIIATAAVMVVLIGGGAFPLSQLPLGWRGPIALSRGAR